MEDLRHAVEELADAVAHYGLHDAEVFALRDLELRRSVDGRNQQLIGGLCHGCHDLKGFNQGGAGFLKNPYLRSTLLNKTICVCRNHFSISMVCCNKNNCFLEPRTWDC